MIIDSTYSSFVILDFMDPNDGGGGYYYRGEKSDFTGSGHC